jgi:hypothetical protein
MLIVRYQGFLMLTWAFLLSMMSLDLQKMAALVRMPDLMAVGD